jgi:hypothetical protein
VKNDDEQPSSDEHRFALLFLRINHFREFLVERAAPHPVIVHE